MKELFKMIFLIFSFDNITIVGEQLKFLEKERVCGNIVYKFFGCSTNPTCGFVNSYLFSFTYHQIDICYSDNINIITIYKN